MNRLQFRSVLRVTAPVLRVTASVLRIAASVLLVLTFVATSLTMLATPAAALPNGFAESPAISGLEAPVAVGFTPDDHVFIAEKSGLIKVAHLDDPQPEVFADLRTKVHNYWDRGLLGLAVDPDYPRDPYVYVMYAHDAPIGGTAPRWGQPGQTYDGCPTPPGGTDDGCVISTRISRLDASQHHGGDAAGTEEVLVEDWCQQYPSHSAGTLVFGDDGALYASGGDGASFTFFDYGQEGSPTNPCGDPPTGVGGTQTFPGAQGGALRSQDLRAGNDPVTLDGTIIRIDPDTGDGLPDNPLASSADANARRIIAYGMRNPFRFTTGGSARELWVGEVGLGTWEEINHIPDATARVHNFGWPCFEGDDRGPGETFTICENLYRDTADPATAPFFSYDHGADVPDESCDRIGGSSISGIALSDGGGAYPAAYDGALFFADYSRGCIWMMPAGGDGTPDRSALQTFHGDAATPVQLQFGPGGVLYYVDVVGGRLMRVDHASDNEPPTAVAAAEPTEGPVPLDVQFDGSGSTDPDDTELTYEWDLDGDGQYDDATDAQPTRRYDDARDVAVGLRVTDPAGNAATDSVTIAAGNTSPTPTIELPATDTTWAVGDEITFAGSATDAEDGVLGPAALSWSLEILHCASLDEADCHVHAIQDYDGAGGSFVAPDHGYPSWLRLRLTATDSRGLSASTTRRLDPRTVDVTLESDPSGLRLALNGEPATTPSTTTVVAGSSRTIGALSPQQLGDTVYTFDRWSDGGDATHTVTINEPTTFTATYTEQGGAFLEGRDIGAPDLAGSTSVSDGTWTVQGAGSDIWGTSDHFHFASRQLTGDGQIVVRLGSQSDTNEWAKAGVMLRAGLEGDAAHTSLFVTPGHGVALQHRDTAGGATAHTAGPVRQPPVFLRLARTGDTVTAATSADGSVWTTVGQATLAADTVHAGLAVTGHNPTALSTATFDALQISGDQTEPVELSFRSSPPGLQLDVAGQRRTTPFTHAAPAGSTVPVAAPTPQDLDGTTYRFSSWSDGGARSHDIVVGSGATTLRAEYVADGSGGGGLPDGTSYLSDLDLTEIANGWGPSERDTSNGEDAPGDGNPITLNGQTYDKGLGVHADSELRLPLGGACTALRATVGIDDEVGANGSVIFRVIADGVELFTSDTLTGATPPQSVDVDLDGRDQLSLQVDQTDDNPWFDHADWADAQLDCGDPTSGGNRAPMLDAPGDQTSATGAVVELALTASDPDDDTLTFEADRLPPGLQIAADTGVISGTVADGALDGSPHEVTVTATDDGSPSASTDVTFRWLITDGSGGGGLPDGTSYLSDLDLTEIANGWGPSERDTSNGEDAPGDGNPITLNGQTYDKGLGVHADSELRLPLGGACTALRATVGIDDEVGANGSVIFRVIADGVELFTSDTLTGATPPQSVDVDLDGRDQLSLQVDQTDDNPWFDHADWADAQLDCGDPTSGGTGSGGTGGTGGTGGSGGSGGSGGTGGSGTGGSGGTAGAFDDAVSHPAGRNPHAVAAADLDGGATDLLVAVPGEDAVAVLSGDGEGGFADARIWPTGGRFPKDAVAADLDGDGDEDLVTANQDSTDGADVSVLRNAGDGTFSDTATYAACARPHAVATGDVDGDQDQDVAVACWDGDIVSVLLNDGAGALSAGVDITSGANPHAIVVADLDGDGANDLASANLGAGAVGVALGNGDGSFGDVVSHPVGAGPHDIVVGDVDGDTALDLVTANQGSDDIGVLLGAGDGTFGAVHRFVAGPVPKAVALGDVDDDGVLDAVTANTHDNYPDGSTPTDVSLLIGVGDGTFADPVPLPVDLTPFGVASVDLDDDGLLDIVTANWHSDDVGVLRNGAARD